LTTGDKSLTGDLTGKTLQDTVTVSGATDIFVTQTAAAAVIRRPRRFTSTLRDLRTRTSGGRIPSRTRS
jgi:hypothetical protein